MKLFLLKSLIVLLPIAMVFVFPLFVLYEAREFMSLNDVIKEQQRDNTTLFQLAYGDYNNEYKRLASPMAKPEITVLGTSRTMQIRSEFFNEPEHFYNAASQAGFEDLLNHMKSVNNDRTIRVVILGVDERWLLDTNGSAPNIPSTLANQLHNFLVTGWRNVYSDYAHGKFTIRKIFAEREKTNHIGLTALVRKSGFRADGSYTYGPAMIANKNRVPEVQDAIVTRIAGLNSGITDLDFGKSLSPSHLEGFEEFLKYCHEQDIYVIGFLPPYPTKMNQMLNESKEDFGATYQALPKTLDDMFGKYGYNLYDTSVLETYGSSDKEMLNFEHGSEKTMLRLLIYLASQEPKLRAYVTPENLTPFLETESDIVVLPEK
jgi:hypothetical protein